VGWCLVAIVGGETSFDPIEIVIVHRTHETIDEILVSGHDHSSIPSSGLE
jgi:hypothetical protein